MHDIDRTQLEYGSELPGFEAERFDYESPWATESGAVLSEAEEYELASELLGVSSEEELDQFLGGLIKKVAQGGRQAVSRAGRAGRRRRAQRRGQEGTAAGRRCTRRPGTARRQDRQRRGGGLRRHARVEGEARKTSSSKAPSSSSASPPTR